MRQRPFAQVDVFSSRLGDGNPVAVVLDAEGLSDADMARLAVWTNLSETTFVLPPAQPGADYRLRIFTPGGELPFAGHPTLGSCHAWLTHGGQTCGGDTIVQECAKGLITLRRVAQQPDQLAFAAPELTRRPCTEAELAQILTVLRLPDEAVVAHQRLDNGPVWWTLLLDSPETVLSVQPDARAALALGRHIGLAARYDAEAEPHLIRRASREARAFHGSTGLTTPLDSSPTKAQADEHIDLEVRGLFCTPHQLLEDPVTGSLNASLAQWLIADGLMPARYTAAQGAAIGRNGRLTLTRDDQNQVWVSGRSISSITGNILI